MLRSISVACLLLPLLAGLVTATEVIPFTLEKPANVSLGIYDGSGRLVRTLLRAKPMAAGRHTVPWDGLDRNGTPLKGDFQWRLATSQGLQSEYLLSIGTSMREHHWPAQHGPLCGLAVDNERIYVTAGLSEGMPQTAAITRDGSWQWVSGPTGGWMGGYDLALDGDRLYFLGGPIAGDEADRKPRLFVQDAATGSMRQGEGDGLKNQVLWGTSGPMCWDMSGCDNPSRMDARDGELAVASPPTGLVVWLDPATGKQIDRLKIDGGLADIALLGGGRVLVVSGDSVVEATRGKAERAVRISGLTSPHRLAVDRLTGDLFIAEAGRSQHIKRFSSTGKLLETFGRLGGRTTGRYQPLDFRDVTDIAGDGQGGFVVTESAAPRRTAHFSAAGKVINEWYGGQDFYSYVAPEPDDPDRLWMHSNGWLTQISADYEHGSWRPLATYRFAESLDKTLFPTAIGNARFQVKRLDLTGSGTLKTYMYPQWNLPLLLEVDETAGLLRPVAAMGHAPDTFTAPADTLRQAAIDDDRTLDVWSLAATAQWRIFNAGQEAWLEVLDPAGKPIVSLSMFRGDPKPGITSGGGHGNYLVFNGRELMNSSKPDWPLTNGPQSVEITLAEGVATVRFGDKLTLERPVLAGDWKRPSRLQLRTTRGGAISVQKAVFAAGSGDRRRETAIAIEAAETTSPPLEPAVFAEAIRRLGKNPDDPAVRSQHAHFAWADANGDYAIQADELRLSPKGGGSALFIDDTFNVYFRSDAAGGPDYRVVAPQGRTPTGSPIWDWSRQRPGPNTPFGQTRSLWTDSQGNVYQTSAHGGDGYNHHWQWPATFVNATAVAKFGPDGTLLWQAGERAARRPPHPPGQMHYPINTLGIVHGCVGFADYIEQPAEFWTEDGLYVGGVFDQRAADGLHPRVYAWWRHDIAGGEAWSNKALLQYDMLLGGNLAKRRNGDVLVFGCGWNNMPVYRVTGWDQIKREQGAVTVSLAPPAAARQGTGLKGEYFADAALEGALPPSRVDERIWFDDKRPWPQAPASVRWTGFIEPPANGEFTLSFYTTNSAARLWIGGRKVLDQWSTPGKYWAEPVALESGRRYPVKIEWRQRGAQPAFHLNWEALDLPVEHVPTAALYPELTDGQQATMLPVPVTPQGIHSYDAVLDVRAETQTLDLAIPEPVGKGWQLSGIASFAVSHGGDTATFEILDAAGKPLAEWTAYRGDPRPGVTGDRGHANYLVFNGAEVEGSSGHGLNVPFTLHCADGKARLELPNGRLVERPVLAGDPTRPASLRVHSTTSTARVRIEEISVK